jgi:hypothetical protein
MTIARQKFDTYLEGWRTGDGRLSLGVVTQDFHYDDPNTGRIFKEGFVVFMDAFKADAAALNGGQLGNPFLTYTDIVIDQTTAPASAWCWWRATDTDLQGAALIHFDASGVLSERIAYFSKLP